MSTRLLLWTNEKKKKNPVNKDQGWEPIHLKYKANENTSRHNPKEKQKQMITKKSDKNPMQRGLIKKNPLTGYST
jgi:hypothetical protein